MDQIRPETQKKSLIQNSAKAVTADARAKASINTMMSSILDKEGLQKRFDELLGAKKAQFISSLVSMVNADINLQQAFYDAPMTVIQSALTAASFDLPINPTLGYAYIIPFNKSIKNPDGSYSKRMEATFVIGYKGMTQLCLRTGAYKIIPDAVDVREGELVSYNRLTGEAEFNWIEDEDLRETLPIIGYAGYFRLKNGAEKSIYMTRKQIDAHERKNRKGQYMGKGWKDDYDGMARKTVIRKLISKYGLMSIDYMNSADDETMSVATALTQEEFPDDVFPVDVSTGEVVHEE